MVTEFAVLVLYGQLHVTTPAGAATALLWTEDEVAQGFAWDEAVVAFGLPDHDGPCLVRVDTAPPPDAPPVAADALWAVAVPFTAPGPPVSIGSIVEERAIPLAPARYQLTFQARPPDAGHAYRLEVTFTLHPSPVFAILRQGELDSGRVLRPRAGRVGP